MGRASRKLTPLLAAAWFLQISVGAQAQDTQVDAIVVRATRIDPALARQQAVEFVERTGVTSSRKQVARWVMPVCIKVIGLTATQAAKVEGIMLAIAQMANVPAAQPGCQPNITVSFAADAGGIVRYIYARQPQQFRELSPSERRQLLEGTAPVRWWHATRMLDRNGMQSNGSTVHFVGAGGEEHISSLPSDDGVSVTQQQNGGSIIQAPTVRTIHSANVVIDAQKLGSAGLDAIAAYAAMVAFAELDALPPPTNSILGLFQPDNAESSLSDWDLAFLKALYRLPLDRRSRIQHGHLVEALLDERLAGKGAN